MDIVVRYIVGHSDAAVASIMRAPCYQDHDVVLSMRVTSMLGVNTCKTSVSE